MLDKGEMIVGAVEDTVEAIVRPAVGTLVNVGFLREDNAVRLARLGDLADGNGSNELRAGGEKDFRPVDLAGVLLVGLFLRVDGSVRINVRGG